FIEIFDRCESERGIKLRIANEQTKAISAVLSASRCFDLFGCNLKSCNRVLPERRPRSGERNERGDGELSLRMQARGLGPRSAISKKKRQRTAGQCPQEKAKAHKRPSIQTTPSMSRGRALPQCGSDLSAAIVVDRGTKVPCTFASSRDAIRCDEPM